MIRNIILEYRQFRFKRSNHYKRMYAFYSQFIEKGDTCFDVGANNGERTTVFNDLGANVIAIEPQPNCVNKLNTLFKRNKKIIILPYALGDEEGENYIYISKTSDVLSTMQQKWITNGRFKNSYTDADKRLVKVSTLNKLINQYGVPKFCKIDVEGYEYEILKSLNTKINILSFEFVAEFMDDVLKILNKLSELGTIECNYCKGEQMVFEENKWMSKEEIIEKLQNNDDKEMWGDIYVKYKNDRG